MSTKLISNHLSLTHTISKEPNVLCSVQLHFEHRKLHIYWPLHYTLSIQLKFKSHSIVSSRNNSQSLYVQIGKPIY